MTTDPFDPWNFRDQEEMSLEGRDLSGFKVHASDGDIGKIDSATMAVDSSHIAVDIDRGSSVGR